MKIRKTVLSVLSGIMAAALCACGAGRADGNLTGQYVSVVGSYGGFNLSGEDMAGFDFRLEKDGKGSVKVDNDSGSIKWTNDDANITINLDGTECVGKLGTDTIEFENFLDTGMDITFAKKGTDAADPMNYLPEEDKFMIGTWKSYSVTDVLGGDMSGEIAPDGLTMSFAADKTADINILGTASAGLPWSLLGDYGSFDTEEDCGVSWNIVNDEIEATYSKDDIYCIFHCQKEQ